MSIYELDIPATETCEQPVEANKENVTRREKLETQLAEANLLVDDIVLKNYLTKLTGYEVVPLDDGLKQISDIRLFKITEMVYQKDEYSTYKFASVFNSVQNLNCGVFIIADSNGRKTDFYMGVRNLNDKRTTKSLKDTLKNALCGQFPGVKTEDLLDPVAIEFISELPSKNITAVSCVAHNKDEEFNDNERFVQGLEKLALAMQGQRYTAVVLAESTSTELLTETRRAYESIYTNLSPFATTQISYGTNSTENFSDAFSYGISKGTSFTTSVTDTTGTSTTKNESVTQDNMLSRVMGAVAAVGGIVAVAVAAAAPPAAPLAAGAVAAGVAAAGAGITAAVTRKTKIEGTAETTNSSHSVSVTNGENENETENYTYTKGLASGTSNNMQLTVQNKTLINTLERIDSQLKRIDECESVGMWQCAAYFLSDSQETAEMAAGTYKALMKGEKSGVETSAINFWGRKAKQTPMLREYVSNFIHPVFDYRSATSSVRVSPASLVSGNELAIQMGLPRKSVCGFPVIEHADFGKEVVTYNADKKKNSFILGKVFSMGSETNTEVRLDRDSLTMHTFITGSTGSGKSNTVYEILNQLRSVYRIPFLVVEPAKGEYKNVFGQFADVYGTNPKKSRLLRINPFRFPSDIHVLEHLDRLVELFNVCWPMYAAMPAILKEAMERAYISAGWDISTSENPKKGEIFPNFADLLEMIERVISESKYSAELKGNYLGSLCTRVRSLTNGLNSLIFTNDDLTDAELFDKNVIVDLSRVGSTETKSLIMGLLVMKLSEYRMTSGKTNSPLTHVTVLEEAHNLLKRTSTEQSSESSNLLGKSVELLANSIAEMRTFGEGFIIADQSPGFLDMSVIRNTNTKIILRLPEYSDRELVGFAASLDKEQIPELSKLEQGVAAIFQNDWVEPVLVKVSKCSLPETPFSFGGQQNPRNAVKIRAQIIHLLIQGRVSERLDYDVDEIEANLNFLGLSSTQREFVEEAIEEYSASAKLTLWEENNFDKLARHVSSLLDARTRTENAATASANNAELTENLANIVRNAMENCSSETCTFVSQCFLQDFRVGKDETETREKIYKKWFEEIAGGAIV
jgi:uncharacterized membrane protein YedE/YeeE